MTRTERLKLAKAARELASEFAEGRGPELIDWSWCGCAAAKVFERAGIDHERGEAAARLDMWLGYFLTKATEDHVWGRHPGAVVFPLLWAADELEGGHD